MTLVSLAHAQTRVQYNLIVKDTIVQFSGKKRHAIAVNGKIPAPALMFNEGDHAVIHVKNEMDEETSVHWHGLLLPNLQDGVPYVTTPPILPGATRTFEFPIKQAGTYWYHSHTNLQEQSGLYGSIVIHPKKEPTKADKELVLLLSDWTDEKPEEVLRTLKRGLEWYGIEKKQPASWNKIIANGGFKTASGNPGYCMPLMDISDVYYNTFLINGLPQEQQLTGFQPGEKVRLRVINGSASSYFNVQFAGGAP
ncbi:MAG: multicopper oxidase domain-containing protein [Lewinellaceae bacterium]|nr:multicopper oxidase domain-containing protein [Lewinellaceae bacterium]